MATLLLVLGTFFWGATFVIVKDSISSIDLYSFLFWRFLISSLFIIPFFIKKIISIKPKEIIYGVSLGFILALGYIFQTIGLQFSTPSKTAFITGLSVVIVPVLSSIKMKKIPNLLTIIAIIMSAIGIYLMTETTGISFKSGDMWVLLCALFFAIQIVMISDITKKHSAVNITIIELMTVSIISMICSLIFGNIEIPVTYKLWGAIIFCAIFATSFIFIVQSRYQKEMSDSRAAIIYSFEPLFAALTAYIIYNERFSITIIIGGLLIFIAMLITGRKLKTKIRE